MSHCRVSLDLVEFVNVTRVAQKRRQGLRSGCTHLRAGGVNLEGFTKPNPKKPKNPKHYNWAFK